MRRHLAPRRSRALRRRRLGHPADRGRPAGPRGHAEEFPDLSGLTRLTREQGYEAAHGHVSSLEEWDEYEWSWTGSLTDWALEPGRDPADRDEALAAAAAHRDAWLDGYRGVLGFVTLVLVDSAGLSAGSRAGR